MDDEILADELPTIIKALERNARRMLEIMQKTRWRLAEAMYARVYAMSPVKEQGSGEGPRTV